jgi:hypothetical protein
MRRILSTLSQKWPEYLLEILVITIGILGAFALNNWNQQIQRKQQEIKMLESIREGLNNDSEDLTYNLNAHKTIIHSQNIVLEFMDKKINYHDSLNVHFQYANRGTVFIAHEGAFETLKSVGLELISNDSLRQGIVHLYDRSYDYYEESESNYEYGFFKMFDHQSLYFNSWSAFNAPMNPINPGLMQNDQQYRYHIGTLKNINFFLIPIIESTLNDVNVLQRQIDVEIAKLRK